MKQFSLQPPGGGPAQTAADHFPVEGVGKTDIQVGAVLDHAYQSALFNTLDGLSADQHRQGVQGQRLGEGQQLQYVRFVLG